MLHSGGSFLFPSFHFQAIDNDILSYDPEDPTSSQKTGWLVYTGHDDPEPAHFVLRESFEKFVLDMVGSLILAEEKMLGIVSGLRIFGRCDVSIYRDVSAGKYKYVMSEITRSYSTCLFEPSCDPTGIADVMIARLLHVLQRVASSKFLAGTPPPPPTPC